MNQAANGGGGSEPTQEVSLIDEAGQERRFRLHDVFDLDASAYYLVEAVDNPEEVLLLRETPEGLESVEFDEMNELMARLDEQEQQYEAEAVDPKDPKDPEH
jgi:hypothetical protein